MTSERADEQACAEPSESANHDINDKIGDDGAQAGLKEVAQEMEDGRDMTLIEPTIRGGGRLVVSDVDAALLCEELRVCG